MDSATNLFHKGIENYKLIRDVTQRIEQLNIPIQRYNAVVSENPNVIEHWDKLYKIKQQMSLAENEFKILQQQAFQLGNAIEFLFSGVEEIQVVVPFNDMAPYHPRSYKIVKTKVPNLKSGLGESKRIQIEEVK